MSRPSEDSEIPFGKNKRDWTLLWRVTMIILGAFTSGGIVVLMYAGASYIRAEAAAAADSGITPLRTDIKDLSTLPPRVKRLEDISNERGAEWHEFSQWRSKKDEVDTKLTAILENQQKQLDRQQTIIDQLYSIRR